MRMPEKPEEYSKEWLTLLIQNLLNLPDPSTIIVNDWTTKKASNDGDNFASVLYSIDVNASVNGLTKDFHFMSKHLANYVEKEAQIMIRECGLFDCECLMYDDVLIKLDQLLESSSGQKLPVPRPQVVYTKLTGEHIDKQGIIVMENLSFDGYKMYPKRRGFDLEHSKMCLNELAKVHGVSFAMKTKLGGKDKILEQWPLLKRQSWISMGDVVTVMFTAPVKGGYFVIQKLFGAEADETQRYVKFIDKIEDKWMHFNERFPEEEPFEVVLHRDYWNNNFLFKYKEDIDFKDGPIPKPEKIMVIDWQLSEFGSPGCDLIYFFYASTTPQLREKHFDELMHYYHNKFLHYSRQCGVDPITTCNFNFDQLMKLYTNRISLAMFACCTFSVINVSNVPDPDPTKVTMDEWKTLKVAELMEGGNELQQARISSCFKDVMKHGQA